MSNARFSIIQAKAVSDTRITSAQFRTLAALGTFGDEEGWCFPKLATLAKMLGKDRSNVSRDIAALVELGYIEVWPQYHKEDRRRMHNKYRLVFDPPRAGDNPPCGERKAPLRSERKAPLRSERNALTSHINAPNLIDDEEEANRDFSKNSATEKEKRQEQTPNIYRTYENEIGLLTPMIADALKDAEQHYPPDWITAALQQAARNNARRWSYAEAILKRWKVDGFQTDNRKNGKAPAKPGTGGKLNAHLDDIIRQQYPDWKG